MATCSALIQPRDDIDSSSGRPDELAILLLSSIEAHVFAQSDVYNTGPVHPTRNVAERTMAPAVDNIQIERHIRQPLAQ